MKSILKNISKISLVLTLLLVVAIGMTFLIKPVSKEVESKSTFQGFRHLTLNNNDLDAVNVQSQNFGEITLRDFDIESETEYYIVIAFVNFKNNTPWAQDDIDEIMLSFNDNDRSNSIYSVKEYMLDQSYGKINMTAFYVTHQLDQTYAEVANMNTSNDATFYAETKMFEDALVGKSLQIGEGQNLNYFHCRILYFPCNSISEIQNSTLWPHAWLGQAMVVTPKMLQGQDGPFTGTYCHELTHILGVPDLYPYDGNNDEPVGSWYLMATTDYFKPQTLNAYYKQKLGFVESSHINDFESTKVESVTASGVHLLNPATSQNGTIAFKFGERQTTIKVRKENYFGQLQDAVDEVAKEFFYVEFKQQVNNGSSADASLPGTGLVVYRVIESPTMHEYGNMYPQRSNAKYEVYILRQNNNIDQAHLEANESYGSLNDSASVNINYWDGTNSYIKITNLGTNIAGQAKVQFEFKQSKFSASGFVAKDGARVANAKIYKSEYDETSSSYGAMVDTHLTTDANGQFFVQGLNDKVKLTFVKDNFTFSDSVVVNGADAINQRIEEHSQQQVQLYFYTKLNQVVTPLTGVIIYVNGSNSNVFSDSEGIARLDLELNDVCTFSYSYNGDPYVMSPFTYLDDTIQNYSILAVPQDYGFSDSIVQLIVKDVDNNFLSDVEIYDITNLELNNEATLLPYKTVMGIQFGFDGYVGMKVRVVVKNFAPIEFIVTDYEISNVKEIVMHPYESTVIKIVGLNQDSLNINISDVEVFVGGKLIGLTSATGELAIDEIYQGQIVSFRHTYYKVSEWVFDGSEQKQLQASFKEVQVLIEFYRPMVEGDDTYDPNNRVVSASEVMNGLTIKIKGSTQDTASIQIFESKLLFDAVFFADVSFESNLYAITNEQGVILINQTSSDLSHTYRPFYIDPTLGEMQGDKILFRLYAKRYVTVKGKIEFPEDHSPQVVDIYVNNTTKIKATTNELGAFELDHIIEGDQIFFDVEGYEFDSYFAIYKPNAEDGSTGAIVNKEGLSVIKAEVKKEPGKLGTIILFVVLGLCVIVPFLIGLRPKGKSRLKEI